MKALEERFVKLRLDALACLALGLHPSVRGALMFAASAALSVRHLRRS